MTKERIGWIDTAKAVGIILMTAGHYLLEDGFGVDFLRFLYAFHMPLFFFLSGVTLRAPEKGETTAFLRKKVMSYLIPMAFLDAMFVFLRALTIVGYSGVKGLNPSFLPSMIAGFMLQKSFGGGTWFVCTLFTSSLLSGFLIKFVRGSKAKASAEAAVLFALQWACRAVFGRNELPWNIDLVPFGTAMMLSGWLMKDWLLKACSAPDRKTMLAGLLLLLASAFLAKANTVRFDMNMRQFGNALITIPAAYSGIIGTIMVSACLSGPGTEGLGRKTISVLCLQDDLIHRVFIMLFLPFINSVSFPAVIYVCSGTTAAIAAGVWFDGFLTCTGKGWLLGKKKETSFEASGAGSLLSVRFVADAWARPSVAK